MCQILIILSLKSMKNLEMRLDAGASLHVVMQGYTSNPMFL